MDVSKMKPIPMTCPTCGRKFLSDETPTPPFCSSRCQLIDLGRWFNEEIGVPFEGEPGDTPVEYRDETLPEHDG
ncbi:DNA gyrase inhibitor YacG [Aporhodopirellula aestuarii]|uniref:DNA gyrase inhibitor YacG n=1 Tax=Aporhodopirellula aestuarii TaxID=2950107 RepID=UPI002AFEB691|nr:DNA gyrase inhibitor YacG [Aporhodopirellula aestuarii]